MKCYPPAETHIPLKALFRSVIGATKNNERVLCESTGSPFCFFGASGRSLLFHLLTVLQKWDSGARNEVLIPGYTCYSVPAAIVKAGLKLRFYDVDPYTLNPNRQSLEDNCGKHTLAVISQHLFGLPMDLHVISEISSGAGIYHVEDAAQAFGGLNQGKWMGTAGDFGLFSFGRGKPLPLGGGGALISQWHNIAEMMPPMGAKTNWRSWMIHVMTQVVAHPIFYGLAEMLPLGLGETVFDPFSKPGDIPLIQKKMLKSMMTWLTGLNEHRRMVTSIYRHRINVNCLVLEPDGSEPVYPRFPVIAKDGTLPRALWSLGVRRMYPNALNRENRIAAYAIEPNQKLQGAEELAQRLVTLPTHLAIDEKIAGTIAHKLNQWI